MIYHKEYYKKNRLKVLAYHRKRRKETPKEILEDRQYRSNYGISIDDYKRMYVAQVGCCKVCKKYFGKLCVDHDHVTKKIRGLLCQGCNKALGLFKENQTALLNAIVYLKTNGGN